MHLVGVCVRKISRDLGPPPHSTQRGTERSFSYALRRCHRDMAIYAWKRSGARPIAPHHPQGPPFRYAATSRELFWGIPGLSLSLSSLSRQITLPCSSFVLIWKRPNLGRLAYASFLCLNRNPTGLLRRLNFFSVGFHFGKSKKKILRGRWNRWAVLGHTTYILGCCSLRYTSKKLIHTTQCISCILFKRISEETTYLYGLYE